ncbi:MAG: OB-fold nucleic acid binding domain-containing protein, partial [Bacillota bacterium]
VGLTDFCSRTLEHATSPGAFNQRVVESLIKAGALDAFGPRSALLAALKDVWESCHGRRGGGAPVEQASLLDLFGADTTSPSLLKPQDRLPAVPPESVQERLAWEREALGFYFSGHPAEQWRRRLALFRESAMGELADAQDGAPTVVAGLVQSDRRTQTRSGGTMRRILLEDETGSAEVLVFPRSMDQFEEARPGAPALVWGTISRDDDGSVKIIGDRAMPLDRLVVVRLGRAAREKGTSRRHGSELVEKVAELLRRFPGDTPVVIQMQAGGRRRLAAVQRALWVSASPELATALEAVTGEPPLLLGGSDEVEGASTAGAGVWQGASTAGVQAP